MLKLNCANKMLESTLPFWHDENSYIVLDNCTSWTGTKEGAARLANDPLNPLAVDRSSNSGKGDLGPAEWLPPNRGIRCAYSFCFAQVTRKYRLPVMGAHKRTMLRQCASAKARVNLPVSRC